MANPVVPVSNIYDSARRGNSSLEELRGIFLYRDLIFQLVRRDIVARYKRSVLGIAWTMLQPLGMMAVTPVLMGPTPTRRGPLPSMMVLCPTMTPGTSVMALKGPVG